MIIVKLTGGLGNQLFQYAAGKRLALLHHVPLKLDLSFFAGEELRNFDLNFFYTTAEPATESEIAPLTARSLWSKIINRLLPYSKRHYARERFFHYDKNFPRYPAHVYLKGYWQSEKYFKPIEHAIRQEFRLKDEFIQHISPIAEDFSRRQSVAVHIRKGDYAGKEALQMHGILSAHYYLQAMDVIRDKMANPLFYIFSDDKAWAKSLLKLPSAIYVSGNITRTHHEDFYLMSRCKHNIIANSSFSWWAAWLNNNPDKMVIAPKKWFNKGPKDTQDLIPEGWIKI